MYIYIYIHSHIMKILYLCKITEQFCEIELLFLCPLDIFYLFLFIYLFVCLLVNCHVLLNLFPSTLLECSHIADGACALSSPFPNFPPLPGTIFNMIYPLSCARACFQTGSLGLIWLFLSISLSLKNLFLACSIQA